MKKQITAIVAVLAFAGAAFANVTITLEDKTVPASGYYNGSDSAGGFTSNGASFNNGYDTTYLSWGGFSYSNKTDATTPGYGNQYSAYPGSGAGGSANYAVGYVDTYTPTIPTITLPSGYSSPFSIAVTNTTYAALTMKNGDSAFFVNAFAGPGASLNDAAGDWFKLTISGYNAENALTGSVDYFLADYRFASPAQYYITNTWVTLNLTGLGTDVSKLEFTLDSSDRGAFGINTPTYFATDNLVVAGVPEPSSVLLCMAGGCALWFRRRLKNCR